MIDEIGSALLRTTACTVIASIIAKFLLDKQNVRSPLLHRFAAILVLLQGWALIPLVFELPIREIRSNLETNDTVYSLPIVERQISASAFQQDVVAPSEAYRSGIWIACLWLIGLVVVIGRFARQYASLVCKLPLGTATNNDTWLSEWNSLRTQFKIRDSTQFRIANGAGPFVCFVPFFYLVLVPGRLWTVLNSHQRRAILLHELAHVKRRDLWKSVAIRCLALPQWFNPFAWQAVRSFDEAAEWACDDFVVNARGPQSFESYMSALLRIAESSIHPLPATVAIRGGVLTGRIRRLIQKPVKEELKMTKLLVPTLLLGLVMIQSVRIQTVLADEVSAEPSQSESRTVDLAKAGLQPYLIGSPDLISIKTIPADDTDGRQSALKIDGQFLVQPDGTIDMDGLAKIKIADRTTDQIERALRTHFGSSLGNQKLVVTVAKQNSKSIYIFLKSNSDYAIRMPCSTESKLLETLQRATFPHPVDFAKTEIQLQRTGEDRLLAVHWTDIHGNPNSEHNHKLLPGDRIIVASKEKDRTVRETVAERPRPIPPAPATPTKRVDVVTNQPLVMIKIMVFEDAKGTLDEFESLSKSSVMFGDAKQTNATLNIFARNKLINTISRPRIMTVSGRPATITVSPNDLNIKVTPTVQDDSNIVLEAKVDIQPEKNGKAGELNIQTAAIIEKGKTIVMRARSHGYEEGLKPNETAVYVAFTAEVVPRQDNTLKINKNVTPRFF